MNLTEKTGTLTSLLMVKPDEDILLITDDGTIIRTPAEDVRQTSRSTQGVRLMRVAEGSRIVDVARVIREEEEQEAQTPENAVSEGENDTTTEGSEIASPEDSGI